ncbi:hypothetical protein J3330_06520 [Leuconostoc mesenteroides]|uniref:hypothetical protein n=1 Tax=Leuconostoc mesenteroides TaxID=1245 RepID=UPI001CBF8410|nr:hypothetical protein [Leuconostoc mesenteroides]MBZ1518786.1 hypothetical protein [Leuconostoc mesenteroides]MBZ1520981.1 hypothetical protein [Leuconostoc mesenteroides]MBZ1522961.1 hypothetical protein [Leuconostoc mesenteroides]
MKVYKIISATKPFMAMFNNYYDYEYQNGEFVSDKDYEALKSEVKHFNSNVATGQAIKIEEA